MVKKAGFIKIHRKMLDWEWFDDNNTFKLFMYCLLRANFEDTKYKGIKIKKGSFITSYRTISKETGLSIQNIRTSIKKLKLTQELTQLLTQHQHGSYSIITVANWIGYQQSNTDANIKANSQSTQDKKSKEIKEDKNIKVYGEFKNILLAEEELAKLKLLYLSESNLNKALETLSVWKKNKNKKDTHNYGSLLKTQWVYNKIMYGKTLTPEKKRIKEIMLGGCNE